MQALQELLTVLPETAKDIRLNLGSVLQGGALNGPQRFGTALAVALTARSTRLAAVVHAAAVALSWSEHQIQNPPSPNSP